MDKTDNKTEKKSGGLDVTNEKAVKAAFPIGCRISDSAERVATVVDHQVAPSSARDKGQVRVGVQYMPLGATQFLKVRSITRTEKLAAESTATAAEAGVNTANSDNG